jgi:hypothetical protein
MKIDRVVDIGAHEEGYNSEWALPSFGNPKMVEPCVKYPISQSKESF